MASRLRRLNTFDYYDLIIYASRGSNSARALASKLKCRRWRDDAPARYARRKAFFRGKPYPVVVNWGSTVAPDWGTVKHVATMASANGAWLNSAEATRKAINKLETFKCLSAAKVPTLKWTTDKKVVEEWLTDLRSVFVRKNVEGAGGSGIQILEKSSTSAMPPIPTAPLYTRNFQKTHEFRVHVFDGQVIDFVEKKRRVDATTGNAAVRDSLVRNHDNGWVFAHGDLACNEAARRTISETAVAALRSLGLLFGAVDMLAILDPSATGRDRSLKKYKDGSHAAVVCEINTGPGLENEATIDAYARAILHKRNQIFAGKERR